LVGGVAYDATHQRVFLSETSSNRIQRVDLVDPADELSWAMTAYANPPGIAGHADGAVAGARFRSPSGLYYDDPTNTLYIADTGNHVVRAIDLAGGVASSVFGTPAVQGFAGDGGAATDALLYRPGALTRCTNGDFFIADTGNNRVRRVAATSGIITTVL